VMVPVIDVVEVGAGGGSIAWIDEVGALKVGPQSAGAEPGPICYGRGGVEPTITDANLVLGRLDAEDFLGGEMKLDAKAAKEGIERWIAEPLKLGATAAAQAIVDIAVSKMSLAVREVSVAKGYDQRDFALVASGGAGPLHVLAIARELHIPKVIVPLFPAHFSALGMLSADERHDFIRTFYSDLGAVNFQELARTLAEMAAESAAVLKNGKGAEHRIHFDLRYVGQEFTLSVPVSERQVAAGDLKAIRGAFDALDGTLSEMVGEAASALKNGKSAEYRIHLDLRYVGQEFTLSVPVSEKQVKAGDRHGIRKAFDGIYERRYAHHSPGEPVEIVNLRIAAIGKRPGLRVPALSAKRQAKPTHRAAAYLVSAAAPVSCPVYRREELGAGARITGPAMVREHGTTTVLFKGDALVVTRTGELLISVKGAA